MAYSGKVRPKGSLRVTVGNAILADTNSGLFTGLANNGVGDNTISIDPDNPTSLTVRDTVQVTAEGTIFASATVERGDSLNIRVRTFDAAGVALNTAYSLVVNAVFEG